MRNFTINSDGGSRGNPGPSACAFVVYEGPKLLYSQSNFIGQSTNNRAEYSGVKFALEWLTKSALTNSSIAFYLDSQLVARQLAGSYKVKDPQLKKMAGEILIMTSLFAGGVTFAHVLRDKNVVADELLNAELDKRLI